MDTDTDDDVRATELETLEAIYPELRRLSDQGDSKFSFEIEVPVQPTDAVTVTFTPAGKAIQNETTESNVLGQGIVADGQDSLQISHLPPLCLRITLPDEYPETSAPQISITATPSWLRQDTLQELQEDGPRLWEEMGRDLVAFTYIDHVQRGAEDVFGTVNDDGTINVDPQHKLAVLDYDIKAKKLAFDNGTFDCGICLDPKKGTVCHKMLNCGHVFCLQCLQDFYNDAIKDGNLQTVRCLSPNCAKEQAAAAREKQTKKPNVFASPSELLQIGLSEDAVKRYVSLKYKTELESDKNTVYCPRPWCNGAARSRKHKKPKGLEFADVSDDEDVPEHTSEDEKTDSSDADTTVKFDPADLLAVCEDCGLAFCSRCLQSWHGEFVRCVSKQDKERLTAEELASLEYLKMHTSPCPTCNASSQKTHGCNHMICPRCDTHFCYLCSAWLDPGNPYRHYNQQSDGKVTSCYMRLWELEAGDGDNVGLGFIGGQPPVNIGAPARVQPPPVPAPRAAQAAQPHPARPRQRFVDGVFIDEDELDANWGPMDDEEDQEIAALMAQAQAQNGHGLPPVQGEEEQAVQGAAEPAIEAVAREAPLVLRVMGNAPAPPAAAAAAAPEVPRPANRNQAGNAAPGRGGREQPGRGRGPGRDRGRGGRGGQRPQAPAVAPGEGQGGRGRGGRPQQRAQRNRGGGNNNGNNAANVPQQERAEGVNAGELNQDQQAWVRRFIAMAMEDAEDDLGDDSDIEEDDWFRE